MGKKCWRSNRVTSIESWPILTQQKDREKYLILWNLNDSDIKKICAYCFIFYCLLRYVHIFFAKYPVSCSSLAANMILTPHSDHFPFIICEIIFGNHQKMKLLCHYRTQYFFCLTAFSKLGLCIRSGTKKRSLELINLPPRGVQLITVTSS